MKAPVLSFCIALLIPLNLVSQKNALKSISEEDLKSHMLFLASDELEGRNTGEQGLAVAARYLAVQAERLGLEPAADLEGYYQHFALEESSYNRDNCRMEVMQGDTLIAADHHPFYAFPAPAKTEMQLEGEVVFAGYGIRDEDHDYDDLAGLDLEGKIVLIMNRAPMNEEGSRMHFDHDKWSNMQNLQYKLPAIMKQSPGAVLLVMDPKSGMKSVSDLGPGIENYLGRSRKMKGEQSSSLLPAGLPSTFLVHRSVADALLEGSGRDLAGLQEEIDRSLEPRSFVLEGRKLRINLEMQQTELPMVNVFGLIRGSDPDLREEVVIYVAHYDHVGTDGEGGVFNGADDNASGTVALLEIAEAFLAEKKRPARSIGILWVTAEEIGLYGSRYFANNSPIPEGKTAAVINLDMVARSRTPDDDASSRSGLTIQGGDTVKVIGGLQSKVLREINEKSLEEMGMVGNYDYNRLDDPNRYFYRSDHISFARRDIPVLFYSTGTHRDYHLVSDTEDALDYGKFVKMTRLSYKLGFNIASHRDPITVDNPMSAW